MTPAQLRWVVGWSTGGHAESRRESGLCVMESGGFVQIDHEGSREPVWSLSPGQRMLHRWCHPGQKHIWDELRAPSEGHGDPLEGACSGVTAIASSE